MISSCIDAAATRDRECATTDGALLAGCSDEDAGYLQSVGAVQLLLRIVQALLKERPQPEDMKDVVRQVLDSGEALDIITTGASMSPILPEQREVVRFPSKGFEPHGPQLANAGQESEDLFWRRLNGKECDISGSAMRILRQDALSRQWVCFMVDAKTGKSKPRQYSGKAKRAEPRAHEQPVHVDTCPFCVGKEEGTEVLRVWPNGDLLEQEGIPELEEDRQRWLVRVLRNPFPYLLTPLELYSTPFPGDKRKHAACFGEHDNHAMSFRPNDEIYAAVDGFGASEVVVESPHHNELIGISTDEQTKHTLRAMAARGRTLRQCPRVIQLMYFKQYGADANGSLIHPHMQICSLPIISGWLRQRMREHWNFYEQRNEVAVQKLYVRDVTGTNHLAVARLVQQTEHFAASVPYAQVARGRIVIAPKRQCSRFEDSTEDELADLGALLRLLLAALYRLKDDPSYYLYWETAPSEHALQGQEAEMLERSFCWTLHILVPQKATGFGLSSGVDVTRRLPEEEAREIRAAVVQELATPLRDALFAAAPAAPYDVAELRFPEALGPYTMIEANVAPALNSYRREHGLQPPDPDDDECFVAGLDPVTMGLAGRGAIHCLLSPLHKVTLNTRTRAAACISKAAAYYAWAYPVAKPDLIRAMYHLPVERSFFEHGGFIYFDEGREAVGATSISPVSCGTSLIFEAPCPLATSVAETLTSLGRFREVTLHSQVQRGATHSAWVRPCEFQDHADCPHGAFAFKFVAGPPIYFALSGRGWLQQSSRRLPGSEEETSTTPGA